MLTLVKQVEPVLESSSTSISLDLNDGTYCPRACLDVLDRHHRSRTTLRFYSDPENNPLKEVIASVDGVSPANVFLANGSGPLLKQAIPHIIEKKIRSSWKNLARHVLARA